MINADQIEAAKETFGEFVTDNEDGSKTITLSEPLDFAGKSLTEITVKKPKAKHLRGVNLKAMITDYDVEAFLHLLAQLSPEIESTTMGGELGIDDLIRIIAGMSDFLVGSLQT